MYFHELNFLELQEIKERVLTVTSRSALSYINTEKQSLIAFLIFFSKETKIVLSKIFLTACIDFFFLI